MITARQVLDSLNAVTEAVTGVDGAHVVSARVPGGVGTAALAVHAAGRITGEELTDLICHVADHHWMLLTRNGEITPEHLRGIVSQSMLAGTAE